MHNILADYYRAPSVPDLVLPCVDPKNGAGFFCFGKDIICYGECATGVAADVLDSAEFDASQASTLINSEISLPFDIADVIENLRREHYARQMNSGVKPLTQHELVRHFYYFIRKLLPAGIRHQMQRAYFKGWRELPFPHWPVDFTVDSLHEVFLRMAMTAQGRDRVPFIWFWPDGASSSLILTHDVETATGRDFCSSLMDVDLAHGFHASFQVVPEKRYEVPKSYVHEIRSRGFEFNIHDLNHDGHLFEEQGEFLRRAKKINAYIERYGAHGFRAGAMYRNLDWYDAFEFSYDMSVPNVAHLEPQRGGCCTVMPYFVGKILELPLTATQDYSAFHILEDYSMDLWKTQIDLIRGRNGLISFIAHPDYLIGRREREVYELLLDYLSQIVSREKIWSPLPGEVDQWWRARSQMKLVLKDGAWRIEGPGSERARLAYALLHGDRLLYEVVGA